MRPSSAIIALSLTVAAGQYVATLAPRHLWGLHHLSFVLPAASLLLPVSVLAAAAGWLHPGVRRRTARWVGRLSVSGPLRITALLIAASWCVAALPVQHPLLGDGSLLLGLLQDAQPLTGEGALPVRLLGAAHRLLSHLPGWDVWGTFRVAGAASGGSALVAAVLLARWLSAAPLVQLLVVALMTLSSTSLLYLGYPETYAPLAALLVATSVGIVLWGGRYHRWLCFAGVTALLGIAYHPLGVIALPAVAVALADELGWRSASLRVRMGVGLLGSAAIGYAATVYTEFSSLLVIGSTGPGYGFLSPHHLSDLANVLLLGAPVQLAVVVAVLALGPGWLRQHSVTRSLGAFVGASLVVFALIDPTLGSLDWDLWAMPAIPICTLAAWLTARGMIRADALRIAVPVLGAAALHAGAWVWANADADRATRMVEAMVAHDPHYRGDRRAKLAGRMLQIGQDEAAMRQYEAALALDDAAALALYQLGLRYYSADRRSDSTRLLERFVEVAPAGTDTRIAQSLVAHMAGNRERAVLLCAAFLLEQGSNRTGLNVARVLLDAGDEATLQMILRTAVRCTRGESPAAIQDWLTYAHQQPATGAVREFTHILERSLGAELRESRLPQPAR